MRKFPTYGHRDMGIFGSSYFVGGCTCTLELWVMFACQTVVSMGGGMAVASVLAFAAEVMTRNLPRPLMKLAAVSVGFSSSCTFQSDLWSR